jgi:hypothetical protein
MKNFTLKTLIVAFSIFYFGNANGQDVIDLSGIDNPNILVDTLPDIAPGSVVMLQPGMVYNAGGYAFDKSLTLKSGDPLNVEMPKIDCASNFNFADGAMIDSLIFMNIEIFGEYDARYFLNSNVAATVGELRLDGCNIHHLRGVVRMKDAGPGLLTKYTINNCIVTMIRDYGILTVDVNSWVCDNILIKNSTISKTRTFITSKNNTSSVVIDGCTINEVTAAGQRMFRWREGGQDNVSEGILIKNTIWGTGWDEDGSGSTAFDGFDGLGETTWNVENTYATNDLVFAEGKDTIFPLLENVYDGSASDLWTAPGEGEFFFLDTDFAGIGTAGDPRWAPEMPTAGMEWNISSEAFNALGEMTATTEVEGLTIYAEEGKAVVVDENGKEVDGMAFTHRLKLGGSGGFDSEGMPINRVLSFDVAGNTKITVAAMSSSSSSDRVLNIAAGHKDSLIAEFPALGAELTMNSYDYIGAASKIFLYSPSSGVNVYYIKAEPLSTDAKPVLAESSLVNIYPNPATDKVYIDFSKPVQVAVYNMAGSLVKSKFVQSKYDYLSIGDLQPGMYLIRSQNNGAFAKKLIKR